MSLKPNVTETIIGGDDLVAVDWVGASKMGLDPMISEYMKEAVSRFGKPRITLIGNHSVYRKWSNVPSIISEAAHGILDGEYIFGNFIYSIMGTMDPIFRFKCDEASRRVARLMSNPFRSVLFERVSHDGDELTVRHLKKLFGQKERDYMKKLIGAMLGRVDD